jgi:hypothetical protein
MKIAAIQNGAAPRSGTIKRPERSRQARPEAGRGKIRHVLHGWRVLVAPLVTQVLERAYEVPEVVPVDYALSAYRRRQAVPQPLHVLRDI